LRSPPRTSKQALKNRTWKFVEGLPIKDVSHEKVDLAAKALAEEKETVFEFLSSVYVGSHFDVTKCPKAESLLFYF
jgi:hypothetical protein